MNVTRIESGIATEMISVLVTFRRKIRITQLAEQRSVEGLLEQVLKIDCLERGTGRMRCPPAHREESQYTGESLSAMRRPLSTVFAIGCLLTRRTTVGPHDIGLNVGENASDVAQVGTARHRADRVLDFGPRS